MGVLLGTSLSYCPLINCHATFARAGMCWKLMFHVTNGICPTKSGPHLRLKFSNPYLRQIFFHSSYKIVLHHEHSSGMAQYKSKGWLIDWKSSISTRLTREHMCNFANNLYAFSSLVIPKPFCLVRVLLPPQSFLWVCTTCRSWICLQIFCFQVYVARVY